MIKRVWLIPALLLGTAAAGAGACRLLGWAIHPRELSIALVIVAISSVMGLLPSLLARKAPSDTAAQAGLAGTVVHLFATLLFAGAVWMGKAVAAPFLFWLLAFYWASLLALAAVVIGIVSTAVAPRSIAAASPSEK